ncbi:PREDICTED: putative cyclin-B3-1 isoform X2 [Populus euphratica]|uniref:B-like cyclin n=1 Tax=Populus euphratica TaxID=75702 RepID=A0AAJ6TQ47_POPEU|nr:PREDICTED: putative cyclin-B3-1 isoform X2 [Populus euphratica]
MVAAKGKVSVGVSRVAEDAHTCRTGVRTFKVYSENEKSKDAASIKSARDSFLPARRIPTKGYPPANASVSKGSSKIVGKNNCKHDNSGLTVNQNVSRKALADVSNVQSGNARDVAYDVSKPMISVGPGSRTTNLSSRKSAKGKMRDNPSQKAGDLHASRKGAKDLRVSLEDQKTNAKNHGHESTVNNSRRNARNFVAVMRKSLPALKRVSHADASNAKENDGSSEETNNISGFPVKVKVSKKVVPQAGMGRRHLWRNRVSDGFILMAPRDQNNAEVRVSRKSVRPILKTEINASGHHKTSRSKYISSLNTSKSIAPISSKKKKPVTSFPENMPLVIANEVTQGEPSSDNNKMSDANHKSDVITIGKSSRRRSYTLLLMTRSKLLQEHGEVVEQEKLPSIDDASNQLEVAEYVDAIYKYYWILEVQNSSLENYMAIQTDITPQMRGIVINWLVEVHFKFELMPETLYLMVTLLDRYLSQAQIKKNELQLVGLTTLFQLQLVGLTALFLASKYEDFWHPRIKDLISISAESYSRDQMLLMEKLLLKKLKFRLNEPTPYVFMLRFLKAAQSDMKLEHLAFYLIELCLVEYKALKFKPSVLCASAIYVARATLQIAPAWTPLLARHAHYQVSQIRDCAEMILRFQKAARTSQLRVTYEKYMRPDLSGVAAIKPLSELPL